MVFKILKKISKQPRKQRLARYTAELHERGKFLAVNLAKDLRLKHKKRSIRIKKGDTIEIMRGDFKGKVGNVSKVEIKKEKIYVEGIDIIKKDGTKIPKHFKASNLKITALDLTDKKRKAKLGGKND